MLHFEIKTKLHLSILTRMQLTTHFVGTQGVVNVEPNKVLLGKWFPNRFRSGEWREEARVC